MTGNQAEGAVDDGVIDVNGKLYMKDYRGSLVPLDNVRGDEKLEDQTVRKIIGYASELSAQIARFKAHTFDDIGAFEALLAEQYDRTKGGERGNMTLRTYDGKLVVKVQVQDYIEFGPSLQIAKGLIDECLNEWTADSRSEIRAIVTRAFNTDKDGQINRSEIFMLLRLEIEDERWRSAMDAIRDAMRVVASKTYVRMYTREHPEAPLVAIPLDIARL